MRNALKLTLGLVWAAIYSTPVMAHNSSSGQASFENMLGAAALRIVLAASIILGVLSLTAAVLGKKRRKKAAGKLFGVMVGVIAVVTVFMIGSTVYLNNISFTKGPVHWHADMEIWACGEPILSDNNGNDVDKLLDPQGFWSNKVGSPTIHEHDDRRMHIEGVLLDKEEASLGVFFGKIGGDLHKGLLKVPSEKGPIIYRNGDKCGNEPGEVQVFVYSIKDKQYTVRKLDDLDHYVISPQGAVPPGDCVIIEFDKPKATTDKFCLSYDVAKKTGKIQEAK